MCFLKNQVMSEKTSDIMNYEAQKQKHLEKTNSKKEAIVIIATAITSPDVSVQNQTMW